MVCIKTCRELLAEIFSSVSTLEIRTTISIPLVEPQPGTNDTKDIIISNGDTDIKFSNQEDSVDHSSCSTTSFNDMRKRSRPRDCSVRSCACCCHRRTQRGSYSWWLQYTPVAGLFSSCDNSSCTGSTYDFTLRVALSDLGIPWATVLQFQAYAGTRSFSLRPALWMERVVPYSSPGFELLMNISEFVENPLRSKEKFIDLYRADPSFPRHVSPSGMNYLEVRLLSWE